MAEHARDRRRTDTRERIQTTALQLFTTHGYEGTSLGEVADQLGISRPAVYFHFPSKENLLTSSYGELLPVLDRLIDTARAGRSSPRAATRALLRSLDDLVHGPHGSLVVCAQINDLALRGLPTAAALSDRLETMMEILASGTDPESRMRGRLAVAAVVMGAARDAEIGGSAQQRRDAALVLAGSLLDVRAD